MSERRDVGDVTIRHPMFGTLHMSNAYVQDGYVIGEVWDDSERGSALLPDDYRGEPTTMNFPVGCIVPAKAESLT